MEKAPADYIHSSGDTPPPRLSARSLHAVCTLSAQICTNLHEIYTNLHLSELDKAGSSYPPPGLRGGLPGTMPPPGLPPTMPPPGFPHTGATPPGTATRLAGIDPSFATSFLVAGVTDYDAILAAPGGTGARDNFLRAAKADMAGLTISESSQSIRLMSHAFGKALPRVLAAGAWQLPSVPPTSWGEACSRVLDFGFAVSTLGAANPTADRGSGPVFRLEQVKSFTDATKAADARARAAYADVIAPLVDPQAFVLEAQAAATPNAPTEARRLVNTHGNPGWCHLFSSLYMEGTIQTARLADGKSALPFSPVSVQKCNRALRDWVVVEALAFHGPDREKWFGEDLRLELQAFAEDLIHGRSQLLPIVRLLGGKPSRKGAYMAAIGSSGVLLEGMGRFGASASTSPTWCEDLERALPWYDRILATVHGRGGGASLAADGTVGLASDSASAPSGLLEEASMVDMERRIRTLNRFLQEWSLQCTARRHAGNAPPPT